MSRHFRMIAWSAVAALLFSAPPAVAQDSDPYEPDDSPAVANNLYPGQPQAHTFHIDGDEDWVQIAVVTGRRYTVFTSLLDFMVDTVIELYGTDGSTLIAENDDYSTDLSSGLIFTATETGYYYLRITQYAGEGVGSYSVTLERTPGVYANADESADALTYDPATGNWKLQVSNGSGGFVETSGTWAAGYTVVPANFNLDGYTDFFLFNPSNGQWAKVTNSGGGALAIVASSAWWPGWQRYVLDLDGDGISDLFLYDRDTGAWFKCISTPIGFDYEQGYWSPGWEIYPMHLNFDRLGDLFLINRTNGQWYWALSDPAGFYYPASEYWWPDWDIYPGDFNGDGRTDLFLYDPPTGTHYVAFVTDTGYEYTFGAGWAAGWTPWVVDLDGNGLADVFLYNGSTGRWFQMEGDGAGTFTAIAEGFWSPGWDFYTADFNADARTDILLYDPSSGYWYQALNTSPGAFTYGNGVWSSGLLIVAQSTIR